MAKLQLVASLVSATRGGAPFKFREYSTVYRIKLGDRMLVCSCGASMDYDPDALEVTRRDGTGCFHILDLFESAQKYTLTPLGRETFMWRYAAKALK